MNNLSLILLYGITIVGAALASAVVSSLVVSLVILPMDEAEILNTLEADIQKERDQFRRGAGTLIAIGINTFLIAFTYHYYLAGLN